MYYLNSASEGGIIGDTVVQSLLSWLRLGLTAYNITILWSKLLLQFLGHQNETYT